LDALAALEMKKKLTGEHDIFDEVRLCFASDEYNGNLGCQD